MMRDVLAFILKTTPAAALIGVAVAFALLLVVALAPVSAESDASGKRRGGGR